jgi:hypothetical protein
VRWWTTYHANIKEWEQVVKLIRVVFQPIVDFELSNRYKGTEDPQEHISFCERCWTSKNLPRTQWVHQFVHMMDMVPRRWYI